MSTSLCKAPGRNLAIPTGLLSTFRNTFPCISPGEIISRADHKTISNERQRLTKASQKDGCTRSGSVRVPGNRWSPRLRFWKEAPVGSQPITFQVALDALPDQKVDDHARSGTGILAGSP